MKQLSFFLIIYLISFVVSAETYTWSAGGDGYSLFQETNWELDGTAAPSGSVNPNQALSFDLQIVSGNIGGGGYSPDLYLGSHTLTMSGGSLKGTASKNAGITSGSDEVLGRFVMTGGKVTCGFLTNLDIQLSGASNLFLYSNDPFNGSTVYIDSTFTGSITLQGSSYSELESQILPSFTLEGKDIILDSTLFASNNQGYIVLSLDRRDNIAKDWSAVPTGNMDYSDTPVANDGPNIIFILLDDLGYGDLGVLWQDQKTGTKKFDTPYIDKMAEEGAIMTNHYCAAPVCAPSRASLMEGLHQGHASLRNNSFDSPIDDDNTMAHILSEAGYRTMHIGKCGIGGGAGAIDSLPAHPLRRGFDQFYGYMFHGQGHEHYPQNGTTGKGAYFFDGYRPIKVGTHLTYTTDVFTAKAKQWIGAHVDERAEQPFFMYLAYDVPHFALQAATQKYPDGFGKDGGLQWTGFQYEDGSLVPTPWVNTASGTRDSYIPTEYELASWDSDEKRHVAMIDRVDHAVEDLIQLLKDYNIDENTIIVFSSDNGGHNEGGHNPRSFESYANMSGGKRDLWEAGIRVPTIVRYPKAIPANTEVDLNSGFWDWLPTFADLAGTPIPARTDGVSLMPALTGDAGQMDKGYTYVEYYHSGSTPNYTSNGVHAQAKRNEMQMIRMGEYKGVRYDVQTHADDFEIYKVQEDRSEQNNLATTMPDLQQAMKDKVLQIRKAKVGAERPYDLELIPNINVAKGENGIAYSYYEGVHSYVPDFNMLTPLAEAYASNIDFSSRQQDHEIGYMFKTYIMAPEAGMYTFYMQSSSKSHLKVHDIHLLNDDKVFTGEEKSSSLYLQAGLHPVSLFYQNNDAATNEMDLQWEGPSFSKTAIADDAFYLGDLKEYSSVDTHDLNVYINCQSVVTEHLNLFFTVPEAATYTVELFNILGSSERIEKLSIASGNTEYSMSVDALTHGVYLVKVTTDDSCVSFTKRIVKR